jgi:hypothetical protein
VAPTPPPPRAKLWGAPPPPTRPGICHLQHDEPAAGLKAPEAVVRSLPREVTEAAACRAPQLT